MKPKTVGRGSVGRTALSHIAHSDYHGLPVGLLILTANGHQPVEQLSAGDRIVTRNGGMTALRAITARTRAVRMVTFQAGCFGRGDQDDITLPVDQPVLVRDWRARMVFGQNQSMALAGQLVDDGLIRDAGMRRLVLFKLDFDRPRVIYGGGLELGTDGVVNAAQRAAA